MRAYNVLTFVVGGVAGGLTMVASRNLNGGRGDVVLFVCAAVMLALSLIGIVANILNVDKTWAELTGEGDDATDQ